MFVKLNLIDKKIQNVFIRNKTQKISCEKKETKNNSLTWILLQIHLSINKLTVKKKALIQQAKDWTSKNLN